MRNREISKTRKRVIAKTRNHKVKLFRLFAFSTSLFSFSPYIIWIRRRKTAWTGHHMLQLILVYWIDSMVYFFGSYFVIQYVKILICVSTKQNLYLYPIDFFSYKNVCNTCHWYLKIQSIHIFVDFWFLTNVTYKLMHLCVLLKVSNTKDIFDSFETSKSLSTAL